MTDEHAMRWGWRVVRPDFRSSHGFRWSFPGGWAEAPGPVLDHTDSCPRAVGDGLCVALDWRGAALGGISARNPVLVVGWLPDDELGRDNHKARIRRGEGGDMSGLRLVPVTYAEASAFVQVWHRHHTAPPGHKFSVGVANDDNVLVGVAMVGRPVARNLDNGQTLEINRTCTDSTPNANSMLYGACTRAAWALGYRRLITYTQEGESGSSLRAAGWKVIAERPARSGWDRPSRPRSNESGNVQRTLWEAPLRDEVAS